VLEVLRQPLEERRIAISRARFTVEFPASFMLIASMNPCPCGYYNHPEKECVCPPDSDQRYLNRISGPLLDHIDLHVEVTPVSIDKIANQERNEPSEKIRERVIDACQRQTLRFVENKGIFSCAMVPSSGFLHLPSSTSHTNQIQKRRAEDHILPANLP
jgi:magnesium chelatase family protein